MPFPDRVPDIDNINNFCDPCQHRYHTTYAFRKHLLNVHKIHHPLHLLRSKAEAQNSSIKLEVDDNNLYCNVCNHKFHSKSIYRVHLFKHHDVGIRPTIKARKKNLVGTPDIDDVGNYCCVSDHKYSDKSGYKRHLALVHLIKYNERVPIDKELLPDIDDPNNYCSVCGKTYIKKSNFRTHLFLYNPKTRPLMKVKYRNYVRKKKESS